MNEYPAEASDCLFKFGAKKNKLKVQKKLRIKIRKHIPKLLAKNKKNGYTKNEVKSKLDTIKVRFKI